MVHTAFKENIFIITNFYLPKIDGKFMTCIYTLIKEYKAMYFLQRLHGKKSDNIKDEDI